MKTDDPMRLCPCQVTRARILANGQMPLFDLDELLSTEEKEALEAQRISNEMFRREDLSDPIA